jgi:glyceraldehyde-3-phosphate dehydrogenase (NADP+)
VVRGSSHLARAIFQSPYSGLRTCRGTKIAAGRIDVLVPSEKNEDLFEKLFRSRSMILENSIYPSAEEIPAAVCLEAIQGRILLNGEIRTEGFEREDVFAACLKRAQDKSLVPWKLGTSPQVSEKVMLEAVDAAAAVWNLGTGMWPTAPMGERIAAVAKFRADMAKEREKVITLLMLEIGKTKPDATTEFDRTLQYIDDTLDAARNLDRDNSRLQFAGGIIAQIRRAPLGVALCMGPYNYPLNETFTTLIPAILMGNTAVVKMARFGRLFWDPLLPAFQKNFPAGVVNVLNGEGKTTVNAAMKSGKVDVLAFIGSSRVGDIIKAAHPMPHRLRSILGLDAKNPAVILPDADVDIAVRECVRGALSYNGQRCTAIKIIFVHKSLAASFSRKLAAAVNELKDGMPWNEGVAITPLPDPQKPVALKRMLDEALARGAKLENPEKGGIIVGQLFFPAVVSGVPLDTELAREEQFGPIVPVVEYSELSEFENYVVQSSYGQQAAIFGRDPVVIGHLIDKLANQICRVNLNTQCQRGPDVYPFTGRKNSAEGTLSVGDALRAFSIRSMVAARHDDVGKSVVQGVLDKGSSSFLNTDILL